MKANGFEDHKPERGINIKGFVEWLLAIGLAGFFFALGYMFRSYR